MLRQTRQMGHLASDNVEQSKTRLNRLGFFGDRGRLTPKRVPGKG